MSDRKMSEASPRKRPRQATTTTRTTSTTSEEKLSFEELGESEECYKPKITTGGSTHPAPLSLRGACQKPRDLTPPLHFLHACGVCRRPLGSEQDIYIYRGDTAFCSIECREQHIKYDSLKGTSPFHQ